MGNNFTQCVEQGVDFKCLISKCGAMPAQQQQDWYNMTHSRRSSVTSEEWCALAGAQSRYFAKRPFEGMR